MKKIISLILSMAMLVSVTSSITITAKADSNYLEYDLVIGEAQSGQLSNNFCYKFTIPTYTTFCIDYDANYEGTLSLYATDYNQELFIIKESDFFDFKIGKNVTKYINGNTTRNSSQHWDSHNFWYDQTVSLSQGSYCFIIKGDAIDVNYTFSLTPTVNAPTNVKSSSTSSSVNVKWTGDLGADGYQVQMKTGGEYTDLCYPTGKSFSVKDLDPCEIYKFRIRGYKTLYGITYYGNWTSCTAVTKPLTPSIKTPSTNKNHQIKVNWGKSTGCSGYQIQYSKSKSFNTVVASKYVKKENTKSYTGKNFTKNKKYYVRVRAYKNVNGSKIYSDWSKVKSVKCK